MGILVTWSPVMFKTIKVKKKEKKEVEESINVKDRASLLSVVDRVNALYEHYSKMLTKDRKIALVPIRNQALRIAKRFKMPAPITNMIAKRIMLDALKAMFHGASSVNKEETVKDISAITGLSEEVVRKKLEI